MKNNKYYRVYAEINLDAIVKNVDNLMALTKENTGALAVVKADGYGHGDVAVAKAVAQKVTGYAVATLDEAVNLRENGVKKPILVLGYVDPYEFDILVSHEITATVFDVETAQLLADAARVQKKQAHCHIKVDTGMRRIGLEPDENGIAIVKQITALKELSADGILHILRHRMKLTRHRQNISLNYLRILQDVLKKKESILHTDTVQTVRR